jgi:hypothetical protein
MTTNFIKTARIYLRWKMFYRAGPQLILILFLLGAERRLDQSL